MLAVFNLNWDDYDIHEKVTAVSRQLNATVESMNAGHYIQFDLTSVTGTGEQIFFKSTPKEKRVSIDVVDHLREHHARAIQDLRADDKYNNYHDMAQAFRFIRRNDVKLAVVFNGTPEEGDAILKRTHLRDFFEMNVYSTGTYGRRVEIDSDFYSLVMAENKADPRETLVVDATLEGVEAGHYAGSSVLAFIRPVKNELPPIFKDMESVMQRIGMTPERLVTNTQDICTVAHSIARYDSKRAKPALALV